MYICIRILRMVLKGFQCFYFSFMCHPARERALSHASFDPNVVRHVLYEGLWEWKARHIYKTDLKLKHMNFLTIFACVYLHLWNILPATYVDICTYIIYLCIRKAKILSAFLLPCGRFHLGSNLSLYVALFIY